MPYSHMTIRIKKEHLKRLHQLVDNGKAKNVSDAVRIILDSYFIEVEYKKQIKDMTIPEIDNELKNILND